MGPTLVCDVFMLLATSCAKESTHISVVEPEHEMWTLFHSNPLRLRTETIDGTVKAIVIGYTVYTVHDRLPYTYHKECNFVLYIFLTGSLLLLLRRAYGRKRG